MKKTNICISVDVDTLMIAKTKINNVSKYLNECLAGISGKSDEDRTREQLEKELKDIKAQMQELSIRQSVAVLALKDLDNSKLLEDKERLENEQFNRWDCAVCHHMNFMDQIRCASCNLPTRNESKTKVVNIRGD